MVRPRPHWPHPLLRPLQLWNIRIIKIRIQEQQQETSLYIESSLIAVRLLPRRPYRTEDKVNRVQDSWRLWNKTMSCRNPSIEFKVKHILIWGVTYFRIGNFIFSLTLSYNIVDTYFHCEDCYIATLMHQKEKGLCTSKNVITDMNINAH